MSNQHSDTGIGCPAGFYGNNCTHHCQDGFYGLDCTIKCTCIQTLCHHITGCSTGNLSFLFKRELLQKKYSLIKLTEILHLIDCSI